LRFFFILGVLGWSFVAQANNQTLKSRQGFSFGIFGLYAGYEPTKVDALVYNPQTLIFSWGFSDRFIVSLIPFSSYNVLSIDHNEDDEKSSVVGSEGTLEAQYFFIDNFFVRLKLSRAIFIDSIILFTGQSAEGTSVGLGFGHEFRLGNSFFIQPEIRLNMYVLDSEATFDDGRFEGTHTYWLPQIGARLGWYF
jgi:hypothetical protein